MQNNAIFKENVLQNCPIFVALVSSYSKKLMFVIYGVMSVFAGITFYLFITETKDVSLPEQMSDIVKQKEPIK